MTPHVKQSNLFFDLVQDQCQQLEHVSHLSKILTSQSFSFSALLSSFWLLNQSHKSVIHPAVALHLRNQKQLWPHLLRISSVIFSRSFSFCLRLETFFVVELLLSSISQLKIVSKVSLVTICTGSPPWDGKLLPYFLYFFSSELVWTEFTLTVKTSFFCLCLPPPGVELEDDRRFQKG